MPLGDDVFTLPADLPSPMTTARLITSSMPPFRPLQPRAATGETIDLARLMAEPSRSPNRAPAAPTRTLPARLGRTRARAAARPRRAASATRTPVRGPRRARDGAQHAVTGYQRELAERLGLPFPILSDESLELKRR